MILLTGDMHIRGDVPKCRTDDFIEAQWSKFHQINEIICEYNIKYWIDAGDIFDRAKPSLELVASTFEKWPIRNCFTVAGNHDLPAHRYDRLMESALGVLVQAGRVIMLCSNSLSITDSGYQVHIYGASYKMPLPDKTVAKKEHTRNILVLHDMVYETRNDAIPNTPGSIAPALLRRLNYDLIVSGHNHTQFDCKHNDKLLVNVGCLSRQTANMSDFKPRVALYNPENNTVKYIYLKIQGNVVSREHLAKQQAKEDQVSAFVEMLKEDNEAELTFIGNVKEILAQTEADKNTCNKVWEAING